MAPKILLADDSMTAQNMGKKILAEGGYEVVTVSNGAAALKKIGESRPELVILDVYMPGYSGLEVCERLRGTLNTTKLPVLLTVGKLEPFKPEEGNRVKADGLLVKPFEATDLLAAVKKLLEKGAQAEPVAYEDTVKLEPPVAPGFSDASSQAWKDETPEYEKTQKIEVPQEMSAAPAMSELLDAPPQTPAVKPSATMAAAAGAEVPAFTVEPELPELTAAPVPVFDLDLLDEPAPQLEPTDPTLAEPEAPSADSILDALMPELEPIAPTPAPEAVAASPEVEFTAAPQAKDVVTETLPDLEPTVLQDAIPVEVASDAALVTSPEELAQFTTKFGVKNPEDVPVGVVADMPAEQAAILSKPPTPIADAPAVTKTAAPLVEVAPETAPQPEPIVEPRPAPEAEPVTESASTVEEVSAPGPEDLVEPAMVEPEVATPETAPITEAAPAIKEAPAEEMVQEQAFSLEEELQRAFADAPAAPLAPDDVPVDEFVPFSRAKEAAAEEDAIAELVERLMERLKPELVAAIVKELKG